MIGARFLLLASASLGLLQMPSCLGEDEKYDEVRTIRIQIEGCKEEVPSPTPTPLLAAATPALVSGTGAIAAAVASETAVAVATVPSPIAVTTPGESDVQAWQRRRAELAALLDDNHLSALDLPAVSRALRKAEIAAAEGHLDEAGRQLEVAETEVRLKKITFGILNAKIERLSADIEAFKGTPDYAPLQKQLQDANTALTLDQKNVARDGLWRLEQHLEELRARRSGPRR